MNFRTVPALLFALSILMLACQSHSKKKNGDVPDSHLSEEAVSLMKYMEGISGKQILTGQHSYLNRLSVAPDSLYRLTGKYPAIWGFDFGFSGIPGDTDDIAFRPALLKEMKKLHQQGSIITITYHQANPVMGEPCTFKEGVQSELTENQWDELLQPDSELYGKWKDQMDLIAGYLLELKDAGIPILFRPYHEMNGGWFWWGGHPGEDRFIALWKQLYHLYAHDYKLDNLIWIWSPDDPKHGLDGYYPGDDYVDIVGCDVYHFGKEKPYYRRENYEKILSVSPGKLLGIGECSEIPSEAILDEQPLWTWFMAWDQLVFQLNSSERLIRLYNSERFITRDELPDFRKTE